MADSEFIKFRTTDSQASSRLEGRAHQVRAPAAERASENPYQPLDDGGGRRTNWQNPLANEPSIREESFYNATSNQSRRERQQEADPADGMDMDVNEQIPMRQQYAGSPNAGTPTELPLVSTQLDRAGGTFERYSNLDLDSSQNQGVESILVSSVHYHLRQKQFRHHIDRDIRSGLQYLASFIYQKEPRRVFEGLEIIRKLGEGPQKSTVYEFIISSKQFHQFIYLINNSQSEHYGDLIKNAGLEILVGIAIWANSTGGERQQKFQEMLKESNFVSAVCLLRIIQHTCAKRNKESKIVEQQPLRVSQTANVLVFVNCLMRQNYAISESLLGELASDTIDLQEQAHGDDREHTMHVQTLFRQLSYEVYQYLALWLQRSAYRPDKDYLSEVHIKALRFLMRKIKSSTGEETAHALAALSVAVVSDSGRNLILQEFIRQNGHQMIGEILGQDVEWSRRSLSLKLSGLQIYTKLTLNTYTKASADSYSSNLIIGLDSEILKDLLGNRLYTQAFEVRDLDSAPDHDLIQTRPYDIPKQALILLAAMLDCPKSRDLARAELAKLDISAILTKYLKVDEAMTTEEGTSLQATTLLTATVMLKQDPQIATKLLGLKDFIGLISVERLGESGLHVLKAFLMQAVLQLQAKGTLKLDGVYERNHISLLVKALANKLRSIQEIENQQLPLEQPLHGKAKLNILQILKILRNTQSVKTQELIDEELQPTLAQQLAELGFKTAADVENCTDMLLSTDPCETYIASRLRSQILFQHKPEPGQGTQSEAKAHPNSDDAPSSQHILIQRLQQSEQQLIQQLQELESKNQMLEANMAQLARLQKQRQAEKGVQTELALAVGPDPSQRIASKKEIKKPKPQVKEEEKPMISDPKVEEKKLKTPQNKAEWELQNDLLLHQVKSMQQQLTIRDLALSKVTSQGIPITKLFSQIATTVEKDNQVKFERWKGQVIDIQSAFKKEAALVQQLTENLQEKAHLTKLLNDDNEDLKAKNKLCAKDLVNLQKMMQETQEKYIAATAKLMDSDYAATKDNEQDAFDRIYPEVTSPEYFTTLAAQALLTEQNEKMMALRLQNSELVQRNSKQLVTIQELKVQRPAAGGSQQAQKVVELPRLNQSQVDPKTKDRIYQQLKLANLEAVLMNNNGVSADQIEQIYEGLLQDITGALDHINMKEQRFKFKDDLLASYEKIIKSIQDQYEDVLFQHYIELQRSGGDNFHILTYEKNLPWIRQSRRKEDIEGNENSEQKEWKSDSYIPINYSRQQARTLQSLEVFATQQFHENKRLRIKMQEMEDQLVKYKKYILLDAESYEKVLRLEGTYCKQAPDQQTLLGIQETQIIQFLFGLEKREMSDYQRLQKVLDLVLRTNVHLEFEVSHDHLERLKNEKHLVVEQREALLRKRLVEHNYLEQRTDSNEPSMKYSKSSFKNRISDYFTGLGDYQALSTYKLKTLITEIKERYEAEVKEHATNRASGRMINKQQQSKRTQALRPSYRILKTMLQKIQAQMSKYASGVADMDLHTKQIDELQAKLTGAKKSTARSPDRSPSRTVQSKTDIYSHSPRSKTQLGPQKAKNALSQRQLRVLAQESQDLMDMGESLLSELKQVERSTEYDAEKQEIFTSWPDIRRTTELTQRYVEIVEKAANQGHEEVSSRYREAIAHLAEKLAWYENSGRPKTPLDVKVQHKDPHGDLEIKGLRSKLLALEQNNSELMLKIQQLLAQKTYQEQQIIESEKLLETIDQKLSRLDSTLKDVSKPDVVRLQAQNKRRYKELFETNQSVSNQDLYKTVNQKLQRMEKLIDVWEGSIKSQQQQLADQRYELAKDWDSYCEISGTTPEEINEKFQKQERLERMLQIYQNRVKTLTGMLDNYQSMFKEQLQPPTQVVFQGDEVGLQKKYAATVADGGKATKSQLTSFKRFIQLKDILISCQQKEIEQIKSMFINKFDQEQLREQNLRFLSDTEVECLEKLQSLELQTQLIQQFETITLKAQAKGDTTSMYSNDNLKIKKLLPEMIEKDIQIIKQLMATKEVKEKASESQPDPRSKNDKEMHLTHWLQQVKDLLQSNVEQTRIEKFLEMLQNEIPIILSSLMAVESQKERASEFKAIVKDQAKAECSQPKTEDDESKIEALETQNSYLREQLQNMYQKVYFLEKFVTQKQLEHGDFKKFYKTRIMTENEWLRNIVQRFSPFEQIHIAEISQLKAAKERLVASLHEKDVEIMDNLGTLQQLENVVVNQQQRIKTQENQVRQLVLEQVQQFAESFKKGTLEQSVIEYLLETLTCATTEIESLSDLKIKAEQKCLSFQKQKQRALDDNKAFQGLIESQREKIQELIKKNNTSAILETIDVLSGNKKQIEYLLYQKKFRQNQQEQHKLEPVDFHSKDVLERLITELGQSNSHLLVNFADHIQQVDKKLQRQVELTSELEVVQNEMGEKLSFRANVITQLRQENDKLQELNTEYHNTANRLELALQRVNDEFMQLQETHKVYQNMLDFKTNASHRTENEFANSILERCLQGQQAMALMVQEANRTKIHHKTCLEALELEKLRLVKENAVLLMFKEKYSSQNQRLVSKQKYIELKNDQLQELAQKLELGRDIQNYEPKRLGGEFQVAEQMEAPGGLTYGPGIRIQLADRLGNDPQPPPPNGGPKQPTSKAATSAKASAAKAIVGGGGKLRQAAEILKQGQKEAKLEKDYTKQLLQINHEALQLGSSCWSSGGAQTSQFLICQIQQNALNLKLAEAEQKSCLNEQQLAFQEEVLESHDHIQQILVYKTEQLNRICIQGQGLQNSVLLQNLHLSRENMRFVFQGAAKINYEIQSSVEAGAQKQMNRLISENKKLTEQIAKLEEKVALRAPRQGQTSFLRETIHHKQESQIQKNIEDISRLKDLLARKESQLKALASIDTQFHVKFQNLEKQFQQLQDQDPNPSPSRHQVGELQARREQLQIANFAHNLEQAKAEYSEEIMNQATALQADSDKKDKQIEELHEKIKKLQKLLKESQLYKYIESKVSSSSPSMLDMQMKNGDDTLEKYKLINDIAGRVDAERNPDELIIGPKESELWQQYQQLQSFKNDMAERNAKLKEELESFKTHFSRYEQTNLNRLDETGKAREGIKSQVLFDLSFLMKERDINSSHLSFLSAWVFDLQTYTLKLKKDRDQVKAQYQQANLQLKDQNEAISKLLQQVIVLERNEINVQPQFNSLQNLLNFDKARSLQLENENRKFTIQSMQRDIDRLQSELSAKDFEIVQLNKTVKTQKQNAIKLNSTLIKIRVQLDMGNYKELVYNQRRGNATSGAEDGHGQDIRLHDALTRLEQANEANIEAEQLLKSGKETIKEKEQEIEKLKFMNKKQNEVLKQLQLERDQEAPNPHEANSDLVELQNRLAKQRIENVYLQCQHDAQSLQIEELVHIHTKYNEEVKAHHHLNAEIEILKQRLNILETRTPPNFYSYFSTCLYSQKERFLTILGCYLDEMVNLKHQKNNLEDKARNMDLLVSKLQLNEKIAKQGGIRKDQEIRTLEKFNEVLKNHFGQVQPNSGAGYQLQLDGSVLQQDLEFRKEMMMITEGHCQMQEAKIRELSNLIRITLNQYETLRGGPGVLKYQQRMAFMWDQLLNFDGLIKFLISSIQQKHDEQNEFQATPGAATLQYEEATKEADTESEVSLAVENYRHSRLPDPVMVRILDVYKRELHSISSLLADEGLQERIYELAPKPEPTGIVSSEGWATEVRKLKQHHSEQISKLLEDNSTLKQATEINNLLLNSIGLKQKERDNYQNEILDLKGLIRQLKVALESEKAHRQELEDFISDLKREKQQQVAQRIQEEMHQLVKINDDEANDSDVDMLLVTDPSFDLISVVRDSKRYQNQNLQLKQHVFELKTKVGQLQAAQFEKRGSIKEQYLKEESVVANDLEQEKQIILRQDTHKTKILNQTEEDLDEFYYGQHSTPDPFVNIDDWTKGAKPGKYNNLEPNSQRGDNGGRYRQQEYGVVGAAHKQMEHTTDNAFEFVRNKANSSRQTSRGRADGQAEVARPKSRTAAGSEAESAGVGGLSNKSRRQNFVGRTGIENFQGAHSSQAPHSESTQRVPYATPYGHRGGHQGAALPLTEELLKRRQNQPAPEQFQRARTRLAHQTMGVDPRGTRLRQPAASALGRLNINKYNSQSAFLPDIHRQ